MTDSVNQRWAATLVGALVGAGVRHAVIAPGSRSTPLALAFTDRPDVKSFSVHDERSAAFFALGLSKASGAPAAVLCTSGTAGAHFLPAVMEANAGATPLVVLTADRPWRLLGFGAPQTTEQRGLFGCFVLEAVDCPEPSAGAEVLAHLASVSARAVARAIASRGPVHFNVPFDEPLAPEARGSIVDPGVARFSQPERRAELTRVSAAVSRAERGVIVVGPRERDDGLPAAVHRLGERLGFPVLAEAASNARYGFDGAVAMYDALLRTPAFERDARPDVVLRFGGALTARAPQAWLDESGAEQFVFAEDERTIDPLHRATEFILGDPLRACAELPPSSRASAEWRAKWLEADRRLRTKWLAASALSEASVAREVVAALPPTASLFVSSSMPVRDVDAFAPVGASGLRVFANRGINGIDGIVSTALGIAAAQRRPTVALVGDVALLHDLSAWVSAKRLSLSLTVVAVNNDGGGIFHFLPVAGRTEHFESLFGTPHGVDLSAVAALGGARFQREESLAGLRTALSAGFEGGLHLIEVRTDRRANVAEHRALFSMLAEAL
ncbi:MAG: 2-succinyl-5-enolpyruvyl-6-hydroxy-3-cyclohexene-1-carboxylic-acid synthase [Myxococcota bacterium]